MNPTASGQESFGCEEANFAVKVSIVTNLHCLQYPSSALGQIWRESKYLSISAISGFLDWTKSASDKLAPLAFS